MFCGNTKILHYGSELVKLISLHIPEADIKRIDELIKNELYPNRSEAIRHAIKDLIKYHQENNKK